MKKDLPKIYVIILNWNGKKDTLECLSSLFKTNYPSLKVLVVDNGSTDDSIASIEKAFPDAEVIKTGKNLGYAGGNNVGIAYALKRNAKWVFILNNDTVVMPDLFHNLAAHIASSPSSAIIGCIPLQFNQNHLLDHLGGVWNPKTAQFDLVAKNMPLSTLSLNVNLDYISGCALLVRRDVFEGIGSFEENFFLLWEEADLCYRAKKKGYQLSIADGATLLHKGSASFSGKPHMKYFWWRNRLLWMKRNCLKKDRRKLYLRVIFPELFKIYKLNIIKNAQIILNKLFNPSKDLSTKESKCLEYRAGLAGAHDYFLKKFGRGPKWLFKK